MSRDATARKQQTLPWLFLILIGLCLTWVKMTTSHNLNLKEYSPLTNLIKVNTSFYDPFAISTNGFKPDFTEISHFVYPVAPIKATTKSVLKSATKADRWAYSAEVKNAFKKAVKNGRYQYVMKKIKDMDLPAHLALIPLLESDYKDHIVSRTGATGAWQLSAEIAKDYGLRKKQRFDFKPSTMAALKFLKSLHKQFGTWELAMAAYNAGPGRVSGALRKNPNANSVDELVLPRETKLYIARIKAMEEQFQATV